MIACEHVRYEAPHARGQSRTVLDDVSFSVEASQIALITGTNGAGKSSLIEIVAGMRRPASGQVIFEGLPISRITAEHRDLYRRRLGILPQRLHLFDDLSVIDNVLVPTMICGGDRGAWRSRAMTLLERLNVAPLAREAVRGLSGGERQRVAMARALVTEPMLILLDEPSAHQDESGTRLLIDLIHEATTRGATVIASGHDSRLERMLRAEQTLVLREGILTPVAPHPQLGANHARA